MVSSTLATCAKSSTSSSSIIPPPLHVLRGLFRFLKTPYLAQPLLDKYNNKQLTKKKNEDSLASLKPGVVNITALSNKARCNANTKFLMEQYRMHQNEKSNPTQHQLLQKIAYDSYRLRRDIHERILLQSLDSGVEEILTPKEMSRRAAARAGLYMPDCIEDSAPNDNPSQQKR